MNTSYLDIDTLMCPLDVKQYVKRDTSNIELIVDSMDAFTEWTRDAKSELSFMYLANNEYIENTWYFVDVNVAFTYFNALSAIMKIEDSIMIEAL